MRRSYYRRPPSAPVILYKINQQITAPEFRLINEEEQNIGVIKREKALELAAERGLDLIEVSPKAVPPVVKLGRYGQLKYEQEKKLKQQKVKQKKVEIKGIRLSLRIGPHDLDIRRQQTLRFLEDKNKVKIDLPLTGRERQYKDKAKKLIQEFIASLGDVVLEGGMSWQFGKMTAIVYAK